MNKPQRLEEQGLAWIERIRQGDEAAFEALFRAFAPGLCAFAARYVGSLEVAEDLVQDLFVDFWKHRDRWVIQQSLTAYLHTAMRNRSLSYLRREQTIARNLSTAARPEMDRAWPEDDELLTLLELQEMIARLPARCRLIFRLSREQGMTHREIAGSLGVTVKTVETQIGRALKALRQWLLRSGEGGTTPDG